MRFACSSFKTHFLNIRFACSSLSRKFKCSDFFKYKMEFRMLGIAKINEVFFIVAKRNRENKCS